MIQIDKNLNVIQDNQRTGYVVLNAGKVGATPMLCAGVGSCSVKRGRVVHNVRATYKQVQVTLPLTDQSFAAAVRAVKA
jgi:hypothetical protein